ncbi:hypothetical protein F2Q70_00022354 [Brassica cretica]|uniref:Uncharacterized protein n=1 Tax=Brassica cretica TaxID=69181 RepID=A0A8S9GWC4_BRACR|nr:hypothetical protein F2Q70_00022354 [Brassica cretica]KAF2556121.1 hypothetical protein F2Q68_00016425 [Brassica cretica]
MQHQEVFWSVRKCSGAACSVKHDRTHYIDVCPAGQPAKECAFGGTDLGRPLEDRSPRGPESQGDEPAAVRDGTGRINPFDISTSIQYAYPIHN